MINFKNASIEAEYLNIIKPVGKSLTIKAGESVKAQVIDILPNGGVILRFKGVLVEVQSEIPLQKGMQLQLKVLQLTDKNTVKFQIIKDSKLLNIKIFDSLIENFNTKIIDNFKNFSLVANKEILKENFFSIYDVSKFENIIKNTGVLFERKILKKEDLKSDMKFKLLTLLSNEEIPNEERDKIKELIRDIQQYQYLSKLNNVFWTFIPFVERDIIYADFLYKKVKYNNNKDIFILRVDIKKIGEIAVHILVLEKNLLISFYSENKEFLNLLKKNINELSLNPNLNINYRFFEKKLNLISLLRNHLEEKLSIKV